MKKLTKLALITVLMCSAIMLLSPLATALIETQIEINRYRVAPPEVLTEVRNKLALQLLGFILLIGVIFCSLLATEETRGI